MGGKHKQSQRTKNNARVGKHMILKSFENEYTLNYSHLAVEEVRKC